MAGNKYRTLIEQVKTYLVEQKIAEPDPTVVYNAFLGECQRLKVNDTQFLKNVLKPAMKEADFSFATEDEVLPQDEEVLLVSNDGMDKNIEIEEPTINVIIHNSRNDTLEFGDPENVSIVTSGLDNLSNLSLTTVNQRTELEGFDEIERSATEIYIGSDVNDVINIHDSQNVTDTVDTSDETPELHWDPVEINKKYMPWTKAKAYEIFINFWIEGNGETMVSLNLYPITANEVVDIDISQLILSQSERSITVKLNVQKKGLLAGKKYAFKLSTLPKKNIPINLERVSISILLKKKGGLLVGIILLIILIVLLIGKKRGSIKQDSIKRDSIKRDSIKQDSIKQDSIKRDSIKQDSIKRDSIKRDRVKTDSIKRNSIRKPQVTPPLMKEIENTFSFIVEGDEGVVKINYQIRKTPDGIWEKPQSHSYIRNRDTHILVDENGLPVTGYEIWYWYSKQDGSVEKARKVLTPNEANVTHIY